MLFVSVATTPVLIARVSDLESFESVSEDEASFLWQKGKQAFEKTDYQSSFFFLKRFVSQYPKNKSSPHARLLLGRALLKLKKKQEALETLKYFTSPTQNATEYREGKLELASTYLELSKFQEALLTTLEIEQEHIEPKQPSLELRSFLIQSKALLGLGRVMQAKEALALAKKQLPQSTPLLESWILEQELELILTDYQSSQKLWKKLKDENQRLNQLDQQGNELLKALTLFQKIALTINTKLPIEKNLKRISLRLIQNLDSYKSQCNQSHLFHETCDHKFSVATRLLSTLEKTPFSAPVFERLKK